MTVDTDLCIMGAGLSGLSLAAKLQSEGRDVIVLEARDRCGGRVLSRGGFDLGPSWIWPHNDRMLALVDSLGLQVFPQYASGRLVFEDAAGRVRRDLEFATMGGALRVEGGLARVTDTLASGLGDRLRLACRVHRVLEKPDGVWVLTVDGRIRAGRVIFAMPPRLVVGRRAVAARSDYRCADLLAVVSGARPHPLAKRSRDSLQLLPPPQDARRPHALGTHLQNQDIRARSIHPQPDPPDAGAEHLEIQNARISQARRN